MSHPSPTRRMRGRRAQRLAALALAAAGALVASSAASLILDSGDGQGNTTPPDPDPGWTHVGHHLGGPSVIYLGDRWVLTANHVGGGILVIDGDYYDSLADTRHRLTNPDGTLTDLLIMQIDGDPGLPRLPIAASTPKLGEDAILIGWGASRGKGITLDTPGRGLRDGYAWRADAEVTRRWGTNGVELPPRPIRIGDTYTRAFSTVFDRIEDPRGTRHEAQAAQGDSGGALFTLADPLEPAGGWVLSGLLFSVSSEPDQPSETSFYGNVSHAADLAFYRDQILRRVRPECVAGADGGPAAGARDCGGTAPRTRARHGATPAGGRTWWWWAAGAVLLVGVATIARVRARAG